MTLAEAWTTARQWVPFVARTVGYGLVSCLFGPLTREHGASLWAMRRWCVSSVRGLRIRVEFSGEENVPAGKAFVYCSNHQSMIDILVLGSVLPGDYKWAAKRSLMSIPFLGWHLRLSGHVPVDRGAGVRAAQEAIERFIAVLRRGKPLLIFPEGTRTIDGELRDFKLGAFRAAVRAGVPVVPVALDGTFRIMGKGDVHADDGLDVVRVRIGAPIAVPSAGHEEVRVPALREQTRAAISDLFESVRRSSSGRRAERMEGERYVPPMR